jgi:hypothetical protein
MSDNPKLVFEPITKRDLPICEIKGGKNNGLTIYINMGHCCNKCNFKCCSSKKKCCKDCLSGISGGGCQGCVNNPYFRDIRDFRIVDNGEMIPLPNEDKIEHGYIFGSTGSGKSVFCVKFAKQYQKMFDNPVYLISNIDEDKEIDKIEDLIRIPIEDIIQNKITPQSIHDSLVIFDDVDSIPDKKISLIIEKLRDQLLTTGRHFNITCLITSHLGANFNKTKIPINESGFVVIFPRGGNHVHIHRILHDYSGIDRKQEDKINKLNSRWVFIHKNYPSYVIYEKGCYLL